jgi:hypothetical protein
MGWRRQLGLLFTWWTKFQGSEGTFFAACFNTAENRLVLGLVRSENDLWKFFSSWSNAVLHSLLTYWAIPTRVSTQQDMASIIFEAHTGQSSTSSEFLHYITVDLFCLPEKAHYIITAMYLAQDLAKWLSLQVFIWYPLGNESIFFFKFFFSMKEKVVK